MTPIVLRVHISENETLKDDFSFAFGIKLLAQLVLAGYGFEVKTPPSGISLNYRLHLPTIGVSIS